MKAFDVTVPPGFVRFDLPIADEAGVRHLVAAAASGAPSRRMATFAGGLHTTLLSTFEHLTENGCFLVFMAAPNSMLGMAQPMISFRRMEHDVAGDPLAGLLSLAAKDPTSELIDIAPAVCLRSSQVNELDLDTELARARDELDLFDPDGRSEQLVVVRVQCAYTIGVPGEPDSWYQAVCVANLPSLREDQTDPTELIEMFDSILSTFRWRDDA